MAFENKKFDSFLTTTGNFVKKHNPPPNLLLVLQIHRGVATFLQIIYVTLYYTFSLLLISFLKKIFLMCSYTHCLF